MTRRVIVLWFPDWPVYVAGRTHGWDVLSPAAVVTAHRVVAANAAARAAGVRVGALRRHALAACPSLLVAEDDPGQQAAVHEEVLDGVAAVAAQVETLRPGLLAVSGDALARYYGDEATAAEMLVDAAARAGADCLAGIADDLVTATWAARRGMTVPVGGSARFLAGLPLDSLVSEPALGAPTGLVEVLADLGVRTLADFAALPRADVAGRFGQDAVDWHRIASGEPERDVSPSRVETPLEVVHEPDTPVTSTETVAFVARQAAARLHAALVRTGEACLRLTVRASLAAPPDHDGPTTIERTWRCREPLTEEETSRRVRWQLDGWLTRLRARTAGGPGPAGGPGDAGDGWGGDGWDSDGDTPDIDPTEVGIRRIELIPLDRVPAGTVAEPLWGGVDDGIRAARAVAARAQALIGTQAVCRPVHRGGRAVAGRIVLVPYGDDDPEQVSSLSTCDWRGALPAPLPGLVGAPDAGHAPSASGAASGRAAPGGAAPGRAAPGGVATGGPALRGAAPGGAAPGGAGARRAPDPPGRGGAPVPHAGHAPAATHPAAGVRLLDGDGRPLHVTGRGVLSAEPAVMEWGGRRHEITGWAGPWPVDEDWWRHGKRYARMQIATAEPAGYLLVCRSTRWRIEATY
ncbi:DNA polymerase Y family protein [Corynebacterium bovis]|uniref:Y-family DNA polymerase n=1 Tax=Corynebacterium bovis TaxID=36808 RepID=UPI00244C7955|nr:DNA polymerase Y family protein [Corynebacterium bovis]MDH2455606.1 DNA polymerase Y family protein [Corynebacterium bovis]